MGPTGTVSQENNLIPMWAMKAKTICFGMKDK